MRSVSIGNKYIITFSFLLAGILSLALPLSASAQEPVRKKVAATFSILGDLVKNVAGERIALTVLVGPGGDSHIYSPSPADARALKETDIVFENGLAFEGWMERLVRSSGTKAKVVVASKGITPLEAENHEHSETGKSTDSHNHSHGHDGDVDPHAWQDVANVKIYIANIRDALTEIDPEGKAAYEKNAITYLAKLDTLDDKIRKTLSAIPKERRKVITSHDSFGYFARSYGLTFIGVQGISPDSEPSAKDIAAIIRQIRAEKVPAVFVETISDPRLMDRIAKETGVRVGGQIYSDSLSTADGPAASYIAMMEHNLKTLSEALNP